MVLSGFQGWGGKGLWEGGGGVEADLQPPTPFEGSNARQPKRVWEGLRTGVRG